MRFCTAVALVAVAGCGGGETMGTDDAAGGDAAAALDLARADGGVADLSATPSDGFVADSSTSDLSTSVDLVAPENDLAQTPADLGAADLAKPVADLAGADLAKPAPDLAGVDLAQPAFDLAGVDFSKMKGGCASTADCPNGDYCQLPMNQCGPVGVCMAKQQFCPMVCTQVCGCDGKNYCNGCLANQAGVSVAHNGVCP